MRTNPKNILFFENRYGNFRLVEEILSQLNAGLQLVYGRNLSQVQRNIHSNVEGKLPAAILLSDHPPHLSAIEALASINGYPEMADIPVFVLGEMPEDMIQDFWKQQGASRYFQWPSRPSELKGLLRRMVAEIADKGRENSGPNMQ